MRILILANNDGGLYLFRKELIAALAEDHELYASVPDEDGVIDKLESLGCKCLITKIERRGMNPLSELDLLKRYIHILSELKPDLVITYTIKPNIYGGIACSLRKIPYAVNITGLGTSFQGHGALRKMVTVMYKIALKKARVVFFENSANRDLFISEKIVKIGQTCLLKGAGVNLEWFSYKAYPDNEGFRFLFVGRVMKEKGIDELLAAVSKLRDNGYDCCLDVVGPYEEDYEEIIKEYEDLGWLKAYGNQDDVRPFIETCDCFVLPSYHEGMANTNLECAASGRPLITSNIPGCKEAVDHKVSGLLCEPANVDSLYEAMRQMLTKSKEERARMGLAGRQKMEKEFDKMIVVNKTVERLFLVF